MVHPAAQRGVASSMPERCSAPCVASISSSVSRLWPIRSAWRRAAGRQIISPKGGVSLGA